MKKIILSIAIVGLILTLPIFATKTYAAEANITAADLGVSEPATGLIGWLKNLGYNFQYSLTFNPIKKANLKLDQANQHLLQAQKFLEQNPDKQQAQIQYEQSLAKYENAMQKVQKLTERFKDKSATNDKIDQFMNRFTDNVLKHQMVIDQIKENLTPEKMQLLNKIDENTAKTALEVLKALDGAERIPERISNAINNLPGDDVKFMKGLEFIHLLDLNTQGELSKVLQNSQDRTISRLMAAWENQDPQARTERFKEFLNYENPNDPFFTVQFIKDLENSNLLTQNLKELLPTIKNEKVIKLDQFINAVQNKEEKDWYLEKIQNIENPETRAFFKNTEEKLSTPENNDISTRDNLQDKIKSDIQENNTTDSDSNRLQHEKDLRDAYKINNNTNLNVNSNGTEDNPNESE